MKGAVKFINIKSFDAWELESELYIKMYESAAENPSHAGRMSNSPNVSISHSARTTFFFVSLLPPSAHNVFICAAYVRRSRSSIRQMFV